VEHKIVLVCQIIPIFTKAFTGFYQILYKYVYHAISTSRSDKEKLSLKVFFDAREKT